MTNAMFILGSGDNLARGREGCVGDLGPGTKAISRPDPNTAATFLSQNDDKKKDEMDGPSDIVVMAAKEATNDKNQRS